MTDSPQIFDRSLLKLRRNRIASELSRHDFLLARVADDFVERLEFVKREFETVLNLGAHTGVVSRRIRALGSIGQVFDADMSIDVLSHADGSRVVCDEDALPFGDDTLDLVASGLSLQWVSDLPGALVQLARALKPDGLLLAAMIGGETLKELRQAFLIAESEIDGGASPRVAPMTDLRDLGSLAQRAGFALPVVDTDIVTVTYETPLALMRDLKAMGASNVLHARRKQPMRRETLARAVQVYVENFSNPDGRIRATFEILTLTAWVPHESQQKPLMPGSAKARLADALGVQEISADEKPGRKR